MKTVAAHNAQLTGQITFTKNEKISAMTPKPKKTKRIVCRKHPDYRGIYMPRVPCSQCWVMWLSKHPGVDRGADQK